MELFEMYESNVRSYCRHFPVIFDKAKGSRIYSNEGKGYIDFFAGAGALNYGHNNEAIKTALISYISADGIAHGLDMHTRAKEHFIYEFSQMILKPKQLDYKFQFCGPTGTNAVEAALKLARKIKKRTNVFAFMGSFHGMTLGSLSVSSNTQLRQSAGVGLNDITFIPHPSDQKKISNVIQYMEEIITDTHSGIDKPAAIILETIQAEGGINLASTKWLRQLRDLCDKHDILLICDDIQVGCYRTGDFFSFESAGIIPDIVLLSKSLSGYGIPFSLVLFKPELDVWSPGEHNGTFRGHQFAFITSIAALNYAKEHNIEQLVNERSCLIQKFVLNELLPYFPNLSLRGRGLIWGIDFSFYSESIINSITTYCFKNGLLIETAGRHDLVLKIMPPLNIEMPLLERGLKIIKEAIQSSVHIKEPAYNEAF